MSRMKLDEGVLTDSIIMQHDVCQPTKVLTLSF